MRISAGGAINKTLVVKASMGCLEPELRDAGQVKGTGVQSDRKSPMRKSQMNTDPSKTSEAQAAV